MHIHVERWGQWYVVFVLCEYLLKIMYNNEAKPDTHHKRVEMEATKETRGVS